MHYNVFKTLIIKGDVINRTDYLCLNSNLFFDKGLSKVNVRAMNALSASDLDVDLSRILHACQNYSDHSLDESGNSTVCKRRSVSSK